MSTLFVFLHGWSRNRKDFDPLWETVRLKVPDAARYCPELPIGLCSTERAMDLSLWLAEEIEREAAGYGRIVLVGHSCGAVLARMAWLIATGIQPGGSLGPALSWASRVDRMVLLAALSAGWRSSVAMSPWFRIKLWIGAVLDFLSEPLFIFDLRRGSAFLTSLRLRWLLLARLHHERLPLVVQVLGTVDDLIAPSDNIDLATGKDFHYLEVEATDHMQVVDPSTPARADALSLALFADADALKASPQAIPAANLSDLFSDDPDDFDPVHGLPRPGTPGGAGVDQAIMVIHGIRDYGFWTKRLAARIRTLAQSGDDDHPPLVCRTVTSSYGFFPMAPFILPQLRRAKVEWFMDQFVRATAMYPGATFGFVGHSNGTYLLAEAIRLCPEIRFDAVVFAGSVVACDYDWEGPIQRGQVGRVLNYVGTEDYVVAGFPKFLGRLPKIGLGSAGHDGFSRPGSRNVRFAPGGHDAGIRSRQWDGIAGFVLYGEDPEQRPAPGLRESYRAEIWPWLASWLFVPGIVLGICVVAVAVFCGLTHLNLTPEVQTALLTFGLMAVVFRPILTKL